MAQGPFEHGGVSLPPVVPPKTHGDTSGELDLDTIDNPAASIGEKYVCRCYCRAHTPAVEADPAGHRFAVGSALEEMHVASIGRQITGTVCKL
jgi:hypothetical protein